MILPRLLTLVILSALAACGGVQTTQAPVEDRVEEKPVVTHPAPSPEDIREVTVTSYPASVEQESNSPSEPVALSDNNPVQTPAEPVVLAALDEAEAFAASGKTQQAIASLERGIRIKPRDPWLWHQLGVLKLRSGNWLDAISIAEKSNSLAAGNTQLLMGNWQVIADANEAMGNLAAAEKARRIVDSYTVR